MPDASNFLLAMLYWLQVLTALLHTGSHPQQEHPGCYLSMTLLQL